MAGNYYSQPQPHYYEAPVYAVGPPPVRPRRGGSAGKILVRVLGVIVGILFLVVGLVKLTNGWNKLFPHAEIARVEIARGFDNAKAVDVTTTFHPSDPVLHCVVTLRSAPADTHVKVVWTWVETADGRAINEVIKAQEWNVVMPRNVGDFYLPKAAPWPAGKYRAEVYLNDQLARTCEFRVA
jgi:hypothetical protein